MSQVRVVRFSTLLIAAAGALLGSPASGEEKFVPLFNGKDFSGWTNVNCAPSTWSFDENGLLVCTGKPIGEIRTTRMYQNFILELEWRHMVPKGNAGVFVWADDITARGQPFIRGVEIQVLENAYGNTKSYTTHGDIFPIHGATMKPENGRGGMRSFPIENRSLPSPQWNHYRIECRDGAVSLSVNGKRVTGGSECVPRKGYLCLESEGGVVHYRNVRICELPDTPIDPNHVATADRGYETLYNGVDLSGWRRGSDRWKARDWNLVHTGKAGAKEDSLLVSSRRFGEAGLIFDVRFLPDSAPLSFYPRGLAGPKVIIDPTVPPFTDALVGKGGWNRFVVTLTGKGYAIETNGQPSLQSEWAEDTEAPSPIAFATGAPLEMANFYFREEPLRN